MTAPTLSLEASTYVSHDLHRLERVWPETNCYVDLWIELLHSRGLDPIACLAFTVAMDFEGDQWTFFKQPPADIFALYGIDVQELAIWRPLEIQLEEQVRRGRIPLVEVDAFYLPDTVGVSYQIEHTKTTVGVQAIDLVERSMGYFHSASYFELSGRDFEALFPAISAGLAPYTEIAKLDRIVRRSRAELAGIAREQLRHYVARIPAVNPFVAYRERYVADVAWLAGEEMPTFYKYAFATLRQCGACAEMASTFLDWLSEVSDEQTAKAAAEFAAIASTSKAVQFKIARMMATRKPVDVTPMLDEMRSSWDRAIGDLVARYAD